eukprot:3762247-Rhodomonas_salina.1
MGTPVFSTASLTPCSRAVHKVSTNCLYQMPTWYAAGHSTGHSIGEGTRRNQTRKTTASVQLVPGTFPLAFDFAEQRAFTMTWHGTANRCKEKSTATVTCFTW